MVRVTGLWSGKDKKGNSFLSGNLGMAKILIFKNTKKESEKHPDYLIYLAEKEKVEQNNNKQEEDMPF